MRTLITLAAVLMLKPLLFSQNSFEKGYFVRQSGEKVEVFLRFNDSDRLQTIFYKEQPEEEVRTVHISELSEFVVSGQSKHVVATVDIDRIETDLSKIGFTKNAEFKRETIALKVLVEGNASLFVYDVVNRPIFFYSVGGREIRQLVCKRYKTSQLEFAINNLYQQQLWNEVRCNVSEQEVRRVDYKLSRLEKYFIDYNRCTGVEVRQSYAKTKGTISFNTIAGIGFANLNVERIDVLPYPDATFRDRVTFTLGFQGEFFFPFSRNRTSVLLSAMLGSFAGRSESAHEELKYTSILSSFSLRQYFPLSDNSKVFINATGSFDIPITNSISYLDLKTRTTLGASIGVGYQLKRYSLETRYHFKHDIVASDQPAIGNLSRAMALMSYRIF